MIRILNLTRDQVVARALAHLTLVARKHKLSPPDFEPAPLAYRLDDSGCLGGDDPAAENCGDWSYGYRRLTADCIGFALYCAGIARRQPGYNGSRGEWLNTDSVLDDAAGPMKFFRFLSVSAGEKPLPGDLCVSASTKGILTSRPGHIGVVIRPAPSPAYNHLVIDCSPFHGRDTAVGLREPWSDKCKIVRPLFYKEAP